MVHNMAESKPIRSIRKHGSRLYERASQKFGKADRTTDELFEVYQNNFSKQQNSALRLQKELKNYATCIREMQVASKALMDCLEEIYEQEWPGHDEIPVKNQALQLLWEDLCYKINDEVTIPLSNYLSQFSEIRNKIGKRGRKLIDYDGCRHKVESLQSSKKHDEIKLAKAKEHMEEARRLYEVLNKEVHEELPALYDSRIPFNIKALESLFTAEATFHVGYSNIFHEFSDIIEAFKSEASKGSFYTNIHITPPTSNVVIKQDGDVSIRHYEEIDQHSIGDKNSVEINKTISTNGNLVNNSTDLAQHDHSHKNEQRESNLTNDNSQRKSDNYNPDSALKHKIAADEAYDIPAGATTTDLPPGVLYKVRATYDYVPEDSDELAFKVGEIIHVIEYDDPEEREEGWLMGVRESNDDKGLVPANFVTPI